MDSILIGAILLPLFAAVGVLLVARNQPDWARWITLATSLVTLVFAAVTLLPLLENPGFQSGAADNPPEALAMLTLLYAAVPCALKVIAIILLSLTNLKEA